MQGITDDDGSMRISFLILLLRWRGLLGLRRRVISILLVRILQCLSRFMAQLSISRAGVLVSRSVNHSKSHEMF